MMQSGINHSRLQRNGVEGLLSRHFKKLRRSGRGWTACCPAHDDRRPSLSIGVGHHGFLLLHCFAGCTRSEVRASAGLPDNYITAPPPRPSPEQRIAKAHELWGLTRSIGNTIAEAYLRARAITIPLPVSLRFVRLKVTELGVPIMFPAMVAGIQTVDGSFSGIQVTLLSNDGSDKAPFIESPRKIFGCLSGGAVRLAPLGTTICLAEGVETGLSIAQACPTLSVWSTLGTSGMKAVELPPSIREVTIGADNDEAGLIAARTARERFLREGRRVRIITPPAGAKDWNEVTT